MSHYDDLVKRNVEKRNFLRSMDDDELIELRTEVGDLHDFAKLLAEKLYELIEVMGEQQKKLNEMSHRLDAD